MTVGQFLRRNNLEDSHLHTICSENLKSQFVNIWIRLENVLYLTTLIVLIIKESFYYVVQLCFYYKNVSDQDHRIACKCVNE
jgi:hypothetical protein